MTLRQEVFNISSQRENVSSFLLPFLLFFSIVTFQNVIALSFHYTYTDKERIHAMQILMVIYIFSLHSWSLRSIFPDILYAASPPFFAFLFLLHDAVFAFFLLRSLLHATICFLLFFSSSWYLMSLHAIHTMRALLLRRFTLFFLFSAYAWRWHAFQWE